MSICIIGGGFIGINYAIRESKKSKVYLLSKKKKSLKNILTFKLNYSKKSFFNFFKNKRIKKIFFFSGVPHPNFCEKHAKSIYNIETKVLINLFESLKKINFQGNFFLASTCSVYGNSTKSLNEKHKPDPKTLYSITKFISEKIAIFYSKILEIKLTIIRISSVYGFGLKRQVIYDTFNKFSKSNNNIYVKGNGFESRDFIHIFDLVNGINIISNYEFRKARGLYSVYNLGSGEVINIRNLIKLIKSLIKSKAKVIFVKNNNSYNYFSIRPDVSKLKKINFKPRFNISSGLKDMFLKLKFLRKK